MMAIYNVRNTELVWRGLTLGGFAAEKINIIQEAPSCNMFIGISGETMTCPNPRRNWIITSTFLANSTSYKILEQDNLNHVEDVLFIRDLNLGKLDIFQGCTILSVGSDKDGDMRSVRWQSSKRNFK